MNEHKYTQLVIEKLREMNGFLNKESIESPVREQLQEQLQWLKHQITHHKNEPEELKERFDWVVNNFNSYLHLSTQDHFPMFEEIKKAA